MEKYKNDKWECTKFTLDEGSKPITSESILENLGLKEKEIVEGVPDFSKIAITDETADGLFAMEDDYGTSYYYRGAVENNYVKFGRNARGQDMWWRIIRINGDGSIRIQYDGTQGWENGVANDNRLAIVNQVWNKQYDDAKYTGWMFGGSQGEASTSYEQAVRNETNSNGKTAVDNWYVANIKETGYSKYLSDEIFCNDRTTYIDEAGTTLGGGYGNQRTYYGAYKRLVVNKTPSFKCENKNDQFTLKEEASPEVIRGSEEGNKSLDYPVGLITADEMSAAGGVYLKGNISYYLYKTSFYHIWSFSPYSYYGCADIFYFDFSSKFTATSVNYPRGGAAPVINIAPEYAEKLQGSGTIDNPYQLKLS